MTIEQILSDPEGHLIDLEKMSDEELLKHFQKHLCVTRPELAPKKTSSVIRQPELKLSPQKQAALKELAASGVDLSFMNRKFRK